MHTEYTVGKLMHMLWLAKQTDWLAIQSHNGELYVSRTVYVGSTQNKTVTILSFILCFYFALYFYLFAYLL